MPFLTLPPLPAYNPRNCIMQPYSSPPDFASGRPLATVWGRNHFCPMKKRTRFYIDGFNLYHAVNDLRKPHYKWLDLDAICRAFSGAPHYELNHVYYFSAYAHWLPSSVKRHEAYCAALASKGVTIVLGNFKEKTVRCKNCKTAFKAHEEKETDVNIALYLLRDAFDDHYDRAVILSNDSDLATAVRMVKQRFPEKELRILTPPGRQQSRDLSRAAADKNNTVIKEIHLQRSLLPAQITTADGNIIDRPRNYTPPAP